MDAKEEGHRHQQKVNSRSDKRRRTIEERSSAIMTSNDHEEKAADGSCSQGAKCEEQIIRASKATADACVEGAIDAIGTGSPMTASEEQTEAAKVNENGMVPSDANASNSSNGGGSSKRQDDEMKQVKASQQAGEMKDKTVIGDDDKSRKPLKPTLAADVGNAASVTVVVVAAVANKDAAKDVKSSSKEVDDNKQPTDDDEDEDGACCMCHCAMDCADRSLFFEKDREKEIQDDEDYYLTKEDPYVPEMFYDRFNTLVYCDGCDRLYHQKCHFVPILAVPRGKWFCLLCSANGQKGKKGKKTSAKRKRPPKFPIKDDVAGSTTQMQMQNQTQKQKQKKNRKQGKDLLPHSVKFDAREWDPTVLEHVFQSPPSFAIAPEQTTQKQQSVKQNGIVATKPKFTQAQIESYERQIELQLYDAKAAEWNHQWKRLRQVMDSQLSTLRQCQANLDAFSSSRKNRQFFLQPATTTTTITTTTDSKGNSQSNKQSNTAKDKTNSKRWHKRHSQELAQTIVRYTTSQLKLREILHNVEQLRTDAGSIRHEGEFIRWCQQQLHLPDFCRHFFPGGAMELYMHHRRIVPRTQEFQERVDEMAAMAQTTGVPATITITDNEESTKAVVDSPAKLKKKKCNSSCGNSCNSNKGKGKTKGKTGSKEANENHNGNDDDSGISLDDLRCCVCFIGDSTDENDVLLCDCQGCYRAYHMKCVRPHITQSDLEQDHWFCPLCTHVSQSVRHVDVTFRDMKGIENNPDDDNRSTDSGWSQVHQVFPESQNDQVLANQFLRQQQRTEDVQIMLHRLLDIEYVAPTAHGDGKTNKFGHPIGSDSEDEEDYSLFDEQSFEERKRNANGTVNERGHGKNYQNHEKDNDEDNNDDDDDDDDDDDEEDDDDASENGDGSVSTRSSQATLVDMSSVEYDISKDELDALSLGSNEDDDVTERGENEKMGGENDAANINADADMNAGADAGSGDDNSSAKTSDNENGAKQNNKRIRRSRRLKAIVGDAADDGNNNQDNDENASSASSLGADFDERNIIHGKRRRTRVDYRKLNDALFGDITESEKKKLDGGADYKSTAGAKRKRAPAKKKKQAAGASKQQTSSKRKKATAA